MPPVVPDVAVVTHNTDYYLLNLLQSLEPLREAGQVGAVHVWDNASSDRTAGLLEAYSGLNPWVQARRSAVNLHHGPALDRLLRDSCQREWVMVLDADTEVRRSFAPALGRADLAEAAFVGQIHPQMPHLYAYLAHVLVHRSRYLELPRFRHHGAPGIDYFRAVEIERRPYVRFRWCDYVHHFGQGALRRLVEREDRDNEFYGFARAEEARQPTSPERLARERAMEAKLDAFLDSHVRAASASAATECRPLRRDLAEARSDPAASEGGETQRRREDKGVLPPYSKSEAERHVVRSHRQAPDHLLWLRAPRRARALTAAGRMGMKLLPAEASDLLKIVEQLRPRRVIDIGTTHGGSLLLWARAAAADATLVSIDLPPWEIDDPGEPDKRRAIERVGGRRQSVHVLRGAPHDPAVQARAHACLQDEAVDFLFLDADPSYEGVTRNFHDYARLVRRGGIVAVHDIYPHSRGWGGEVPRFWRELRERHRHVELIADRAQDGFGIGVIWI